MSPLLLFATLREAGYLICAHPRVMDNRCQDCGSWKSNGLWGAVSMDYPREPYVFTRS